MKAVSLISLKSSTTKYRRWSEKEVALLKKLYPQIVVSKLERMFPCRSKATMVAKARSLELPSAKLWQAWENEILSKHFAEASREKIETILSKRTWLAIRAQGERLGLKRRCNKPKLSVNENYFKHWSCKMAYVLGFILADGCIIEGSYVGYSGALKFGVQRRDIDILEKIKHELAAEHAISIVGNAARLSIASQKIVDDLKKLGVSYRKSLREQITDIPQEYICDFIRGFVDGDGAIKIDKKGYPNLSVCGGRKIISFIREHFLSKFDAYSKLSRRTRSENSNLYLFEIAYRCTTAQTLLNYLYSNSNLYLERKFQLAKRCLEKKMKFKKNYTNREDDIIRRFYPTEPESKFQDLLSHRKWSNIQARAWKLGINKYKRREN